MPFELGVCDYPEHVSNEHWQDMPERMKSLGLAYVRVAEFAWSKLEPKPGVYEFAWLDDAIEALHAKGLKVVMCTPTATPPAWLIRAHPDILAVDVNGHTREFGSRRHSDFSSETWWRESKRIVQVVAKRYGQHPGVVGWQTDNEYGCHDTARSYSENAKQAFRRWLEAKYASLEALNEAWGNAFWSQEYTAWAEIGLPNLTVTEPNPSHVLDFYRFSSDQVAAYDRMQTEIIREHSPGRFVTHNYMIFESGFDHYKAAEHLDFVSWDSYPLGTLELFGTWVDEQMKLDYARTGHPDLTGFIHDLYRGLKRKGFWVIEQQCGQTNWATYNPLPASGAVKLWTLQAMAHGCDTVSYFRWEAATMAQEVLHSGLLSYDGSPDRGFWEVQALAPHLEKFSDAGVTTKVALLHDYESLWAYQQQRHGVNASYWGQVMQFYAVARAHGLDVDVIHPDADLTGYSLILAPALTLMGETRAAHLERAARAGAHIVFGSRTGFRTPSGRAWNTRAPGPLAEALGVRLKNYDSLRPGLQGRMEMLDMSFQTHTWNESLEVIADDVVRLGTFQDDPLYNEVGVTMRGVGQGSMSYIGAWGESLVTALLEYLAPKAGLKLEKLPKGLRLSRRGGLVYAQNWSRGGLVVPVPDGAEFVYGNQLLEPAGVAVYRVPA